MDEKFFAECEQAIKDAYESSVTQDEAEKLAAKFLHAQLKVSAALRDADLDARMKKSGLKAVKAQTYVEECGKYDKKPTEAQLEAAINLSELVNKSQDEFDSAEVNRDYLLNLLSVFREGHQYYRAIFKGTFNG